MKFTWLKYLLLSTFVFWATGAAKYTHEALEHHGQDASVDDGDDDDDSSSLVAATPANPSTPGPTHPAKHPCPVCQMLAGMVVDRSTPPALPTDYSPLVETLAVSDHIAPIVQACFVKSARDPPAISTPI